MGHHHETTITRWGKAHAWWQQVPDMDLDRWGVLTTLATYADENGLCYPSQATIARSLKRSRPWVNRVIGELAQAGLIQKTSRTRAGNNGTTSCEYRIVTDPGQLSDGERLVSRTTPPGHDGDTARHPGDTTQPETKQNNPAPAAARDPDENNSRGRPADAKRQPVPDDWAPSPATMAVAVRLRPDEDLEAHVLMFASRSRANGYLYASGQVDQAWLGWLAEDRLRERRKGRTGDDARAWANSGPPRDAGERRFAAWAAAAAVPRAKARAPTKARREADNPWR